MTAYEMLKARFAELDEALDNVEPGSKEHAALLDEQIKIHERLMAEDKAQTDLEFKNQELMKPWVKKLDINTIVAGLFTIGGMALTLNFEKVGNITSKAFSWIPRPKMK